MALIVQTLVLGLLTGGVYALVAAGLALIFGVMKVATFAHGEMAMIGGYTAFYVLTRLSVPFPLAVVAAALAGGIGGWLMSATLLRPFHKGRLDRPAEYVLIVTFALSQFLISAAINLLGAEPKSATGLWPSTIHFGRWVNVLGDRVVALGGSAVFFALLVLLIYKTDTGRAWRALADSRLGAQVVGVDVLRQSSLCIAAASALAGAAGALLLPITSVYPTMGSFALIKGYVVIVIGGLGSVRGAAVGGLLLGVVEVFPTAYITGNYRDAYGFLLMIVVLLVFPRGIFGTQVREL